ncbi:FtsQ-type POTRA domain-containing protein [Candidatus Gottesmanbacteria bacterium]|nr:FtsQ-type POTRA domain-containing protein [Candidatus Gottesmanbacteria bacterium]
MKSRSKLTILAISIIFLTGILFVISSLRLKQVFVITSDKNIAGLKILKSENLLFVNEENIKKNLLDKNPWIEEVNITKKLPDKLFISLKQRKPKIYIKSLSEIYQVAEDGTILDIKKDGESFDLPLINIDGLIVKKGDKLPSPIKNLVSFVISDIRSIKISSSNLDLKTQIATIVLNDETKITVPLHNLDPNFPTSLQTIVERFRIEGKSLAGIDFRFEKPVITFK